MGKRVLGSLKICELCLARNILCIYHILNQGRGTDLCNETNNKITQDAQDGGWGKLFAFWPHVSSHWIQPRLSNFEGWWGKDLYPNESVLHVYNKNWLDREWLWLHWDTFMILMQGIELQDWWPHIKRNEVFF